MALTAIAINNTRSRAKPYKLSDERALYLLVTPAGGKYWRMQYRHLDKDKTLSLGVWPEVSLAEGLSPAAEKKLKRAQIDSNITFKLVAEEWCSRSPARRTLEKVRWLLEMACPIIGDRPLDQIEVQEVLLVLWKPEATGRMRAPGACAA